jgi:proline iminopeptidase
MENSVNSLKQELIDVEGATLEIYRGSDKYPIICCQHPHTSNLERFRWYADKTGFIYVVVRGLGNSSPIRGANDLTYLQAVHDLEAIRRKLAIEHWVMQGFSAGSQVALLYALTYPDSLDGLITIAGFAKGSHLCANPNSLCSPRYPDYQADLEALRHQRLQRLPTALPFPDYYWTRLTHMPGGSFAAMSR